MSMAAFDGDVEKCNSVLKRGFRDFNAECFGRFGMCGKTLNGISPRKIAVFRENKEIIEIFNAYTHISSKKRKLA